MLLPATKDSDTVAEVFDHRVHQRRTVPNPSYETWKETKFRNDLREDIETYCQNRISKLLRVPTATDDDFLLVQNTLDELYEDAERLFCGGSAIGDIVDASKAPRQWGQRLMGKQPYFRVWLEEELESYLKKRNNKERQRWEEAWPLPNRMPLLPNRPRTTQKLRTLKKIQLCRRTPNSWISSMNR